jgi:hypothetical protein
MKRIPIRVVGPYNLSIRPLVSLYYADKPSPVRMEYGRYLTELRLGRALRPEEFVIRRDRDVTNNDPSNFKVVSANAARSRSSNKEIRYEVNENGCHVCVSHASFNRGYPMVYRDGYRQMAHRYTYEQRHGRIPPGLLLRHKCDNPPCINVDHLEPGTYADNSRDMLERDRSAGKFTRQDIADIRRNTHVSSLQLAVEYGVHRSTIARIRAKSTWKHIT